MAGRAYAQRINPRVVQQRQVQDTCNPVWIPLTPCVGDCNSATQTLTQLNCPVPPYSLYSVSDCSSSLPCTCNIADIQQYINNAVTCGSCNATPEGESCYFFCPEPNFTLTGQNSIKCIRNSENAGWAIATPQNGGQFPACVETVPFCPPITGTGAMNTYYGVTPFGVSNCVGAQQGDVCYMTCWPNYFSQDGNYKATCTLQNGQYQWDTELNCVCQGDCLTGPECSTPQGVNTQQYQYAQTNVVP